MNCFKETEFIIDYIENNIYDVNLSDISPNGTDELILDWYMPCIKEKNQI